MSRNEQYSALNIARILDANLDRAREGLRVIEEWHRLGLENGPAAQTCKEIRQGLGQFHAAEWKAARAIESDPGTAITHPQEAQRPDITALFAANFARVQEALRVLEEYAKLADPGLAAACKQWRYQVYALESQTLPSPKIERMTKLNQAPLYLVTSPQPGLLETVEAALKGGLKLVQYRDKDANDEDRYPRAQALRALCQQYGALFLVNDRVDLAIAVGADGVHLGQQDLPIAVTRRLLGPDKIIGRSTTNSEEMSKAIAEGADYIGVGPVYATPTKEKKPAGLEYVRYAQQNASVPWYAIGGIDGKRLPEVQAAGAKGVAVVRAIMQADSPTTATAKLLAQLANTPKFLR
ncbi:MAG: thiamine phosphate synthase [Cyanobacteria bacterium P01_H01_bin.15]